MPRLTRFLAIAAVLGLAVPLRAQDSVPPSRTRVEEALLPTLRIKGKPETHTLAARMRHYGVPAVSIAVIRGGAIEWAGAYGLRQTDPISPADESTLFQAASISKPVAALGMLRLVAAGKLSLDEDVNMYLRRWRLPPFDSVPDRPV
ncbi:MAG TPA: serine hydrolase domain-containing protein, partial [Gemmatimonadales bacterium]|nr:serine hydrolase domain-containing protein [Gemmatimonadales bacterium]